MTSRTVGLCCHCSDGLPYGKYHFDCFICDLSFCNTCHGAHPRDHFPGVKKALDVAIVRGAEPIEKDCKSCMKLCWARTECSECDLVWCQECKLSKFSELQEHPHKTIITHQIPDLNGLEYINRRCEACRSGSSIVHCTKCYQGVSSGEVYYECKHCANLYGAETPMFCQSCIGAGHAEHDPSHQFESLIYTSTPEVTGGDMRAKCLECFTVLPNCDSKTMIRHPHAAFEVMLGPDLAGRLNAQAHRTCPFHEVKKILLTQDRHCRELKCEYCFEYLPKDPWSQWCMTCGDWEACEACFNKGIVHHHHQLITIQHIQTTPPNDYGIICAKGDTPERACDICKENFQSQITPYYLKCTTCKDFDVCNTCLDSPSTINLSHPSCPLSATGQQYFTIYEAVYPDGFVEQQLASRDEWLKTNDVEPKSATSGVGPAWEVPQKQKVLRRATAGKIETAKSVMKLANNGLKLANTIAGYVG